ncbi:hypothetical protein BDZ89DRAFT_1060725, partial [Hymenopellis radicata]
MSQPSIPNHGCTCGHCAGGWLSPRMVYQLGRTTSPARSSSRPSTPASTGATSPSSNQSSKFFSAYLFLPSLHDWTLTADAV